MGDRGGQRGEGVGEGWRETEEDRGEWRGTKEDGERQRRTEGDPGRQREIEGRAWRESQSHHVERFPEITAAK